MKPGRHPARLHRNLITAFLCIGFLVGCTVVGPAAIRSGRLTYNEAISETNNQRLFVISCGFENGTCGAGDHIDHGGEGLGVAVSTGTCSGGLEKAVQAFHPGIGIG